MRNSSAVLALLLGITAPLPVSAQTATQPAIVHDVGTVHFATSCRAEVQPQFNHAVALLHSFAFGQATEGFNGVLRSDARCTMAWWGIALSAWGNPFAAGVKPGAQIERGLAAVRQGRATGNPTPREVGYLEAVAKLFEHADTVPQRTRVLAYRDAMADLVATEPADTEAMIFHAVALSFSADPTDKTFANQLAAGATLERLFARLPDHPGLAHYIIHSYDVPPLAHKALDAANRYALIAPAISHALHMPSHTYTRSGYWQQSVRANIASANAARREGSTAEELHSFDYRAYAYLQMAQDRAVRELLAALPDVVRRFDPTAIGTAAPPAAGFFAMAAIPARYALERGAWSEAAALAVHAGPTPFANSLTWFARGIGGARSGKPTVADSAITELEHIRDRLQQAHEDYWSEQSEIQRRATVAWRDFMTSNRAQAIFEMRDAADREDLTEKNAITPGPLAPARELLGDMLLAAHEPNQALVAYEATLQHEPNRFRALAGAARAASAAGNVPAARKYYAALLTLGAHADKPLRAELIEAHKALGR